MGKTAEPISSEYEIKSTLLDTGDLARIFRCSRKTIQNYVAAGKLPTPAPLPGGRYWRANDISKWIDAKFQDTENSPTSLQHKSPGRPTKAAQVKARRSHQ